MFAVGRGYRFITFRATESIRFPATPGAGWRFAGKLVLPGLLYRSTRLKGMAVLRPAPPLLLSYVPEYGSQSCPAFNCAPVLSVQTPAALNEPPCAPHNSLKFPVRSKALGTPAR